MRQLTCDLLVTIDGFAGGVDQGPFFGHDGPDLRAWVAANLDAPQAVLMGRVTYEAMAAISTGATDPVSTRMTELPKIVISNTLQAPLAWPNTRLVRGDLRRAITSLKQETGPPLRSIGSVTLVKSLLALDAVDRLRLVVFPLALGQAGRVPAFVDMPETAFDSADSTVLDGKLVAIEYRRAGVL